ncbi:MAG: helix-turn-helix domain-containing protein [Chloroflexi bacterium]|nr:helix-turn-helix domain-containing protein [Chloroflexota bacterium]
MPDNTFPQLDPLIHAPARLHILSLLAHATTLDFLYLLHATQLTRGNLSSHLSKLEQAGYIQIEKTFRGKYPLTLCRLTDTGREALRTYHQAMQSILDGLKPALFTPRKKKP